MPLPEGFTLEKQPTINLPEGFKLEQPTRGGMNLPAGFTLEKPEPTPQEQSSFRQVADLPVQFTKGIVEGARMMTDIFGANNPISKTLRGIEDYVGALASAQSKNDAKEISRIMKEAEDKGVADQVLAAVKAFSVAPADVTARVFGNAMPAIAGGLASYLLRGGALASSAVGYGTGMAMGAGSSKGSIYEATKEALAANTKMSPEEIEKRAALAQSYGGENLDLILMGTAFGALGATTGIEPMLARQLASRIVKSGAGKILEREALQKAEAEATKKMAQRGAKKQAAITTAQEMSTEFGQESQEQIAQNIALQREGFDVPTYRGAVAAGTLGALSAAGPGAIAGGQAGRQAVQRQQFEETPEGQAIRDIDALLAQEEKQLRIAELEQKPTKTKQDKAELDALKQSVSGIPTEAELEAEAERAAIQAPPLEIKELEGPEPPDIFAPRKEVVKETPPAAPVPNEAWTKNFLTRQELLTRAEELGKESERLLDEFNKLPLSQQHDSPLRQRRAELTAEHDRLLAQVDALDAARKELSTAPKKPDTSGFLIRKTRGQDEWTLTKDGKVLGTYGSKKQAEKAEQDARVKKFDEFYEAKKEAVAEEPEAAPAAEPITEPTAKEDLDRANKLRKIRDKAEKRLRQDENLESGDPRIQAAKDAYAAADAAYTKFLKEAGARTDARLDAIEAEKETKAEEAVEEPTVEPAITEEAQPKTDEDILNKIDEEGIYHRYDTALKALAQGDEIYATDATDTFRVAATTKNLKRLTTPQEIEDAIKAGLEIFGLETEAGNAARAEELHTKIRTLTDQQQALLSKNGRPPNAGTKKREQWDQLGEQIDKAKKEWTELTRKEPPSDLLFAAPSSEDNFDAWFGDSKTTDSTGNAMVLYTGTSKDKDFTAFNIPKNGVWLTTDPSEASQYAMENDSMGFKWEGVRPVAINTASRVIPVYARIEKPYTITEKDLKQINVDNYKRAQGQFFDTLRAAGYDGVNMGGGVWVVLNSPNQLKSAIGNDGNYSLTKPNIIAAPLEGHVGKGLHPSVAEAVRNDDLNGALRAMAQNTSGFTRALAARLAELDLPTSIVIGRQRQIIRKLIDAQTAPQQTRFFSFISQMYPDVYDKYFKNFDREENLERVMDGLQELDKPKYKLFAVEQDFKDILKAFADTVPHMNAPGFFSTMFDAINLNPHPQFGTSNRVLLHEVVHAATEYILKHQVAATPRQQQAIIELNRMFKYARDRIPTKEYGFKNISEFVAEAMTNPDFQRKLKSISYQARPGSLFTRFIRAIQQLLGLDNLAGASAVEIDALFSAARPRTVTPMPLVFSKAKKDKSVSYLGKAGTFKVAEDVEVSIKQKIGAVMKRHPDADQALKDLAPSLWKASGWAARAAVLPFLQLRQLKDLTANKFPQLAAAVRIVGDMISFRGNKLREAESVIQKWAPLQAKYPARSNLMGRLMVEATIRGVEVDPEGPGYNASKVPEPIKRAWNTLKPEFHQIYRETRDFYTKSVQDMVQTMKDRTAGLPTAERAKKLREIDAQFGPDKLTRPYFPLRRFGEFWFQVGEGADKEFYMFEGAISRELAFRKRRRELQNSKNEKDQELAKTMRTGNGISNLLSQNAATTRVLKDVQELVSSLTINDPAALKKEINDSINQLIYILLPQQSMRKMFINRRSIQGASADMLRVFAQTAVHSAYQQARYKFAEPFINNVSNAHSYVNAMVDAGALEPGEDQVYRDYINELEARSKTVLGVEDKSAFAKLAGRITETTFFFMLTAPASAMLNIIGMHTTTMPYIGGRYGYKEANALMLKNLGRYFKTIPTRTINPLKEGDLYNVSFPSIVEGADLSPLLKRAAQVFVDDGDINISTSNDVFNMSEQPSALYTGRMNTVKRAISGLFHNAERLNREVTLLTTFELAYNKLKGEPKTDIRGEVMRDKDGKPLMRSDEEAFIDAIEEAREIAGITLGDYTRQMKGRRFAEIPSLNVILQFKQYAITTSYILLRNLYLSLGAPLSKGELDTARKKYIADGLSDEEVETKMGELEAYRKATYKEARRRLAGILGMAFLYGGAAAMPFFSMLGGLVRMFDDDDDDDEFYNWENSFYNGVEDSMANAAVSLFTSKGGDPKSIEAADATGRAIGHSLTRGLASTLTGSSFADRTSFDILNLWFREGRFSSDIRDSLKEDVIANLGPAVGLGFNWVDAYKLMQEGQIARAFETALPALFAKPLTAVRLGTEGAVTRKGEVVGNLYADEFTMWELAMQFIGLQPEKLAMTQKSAIQAKEKEQRILTRENDLMNRVWMDYSTGASTFEDSLNKLMDFAERYPYLKITPETILENINQRMENKVEAEAIGAKLDKRLRPITEPMLYQR